MKVIKVKNYIYSLEGIRRVGRLGKTSISLLYTDSYFEIIDFEDGEEEMCETCFNTIYKILNNKE